MKRLVLVFLFFACLTGCGMLSGGSTKTKFSGSKTQPGADSGGGTWEDESSTAPSIPSSVSRTPGRLPSSSVKNAKVCQVDDKGKIATPDEIQVESGKGLPGVHGLGAGCIDRPIREVWAVILNHSAMKDDDISDYNPTPRPDLSDPNQNIFFVFDIESIVKRFLVVQIKWKSRWFHTVTEGDLENPKQVDIQFEKIEGSSFVKLDKEEYLLEQVVPNVTSFVMEQNLNASFCNEKRIHKNIEGILQKLRTEIADWTVLEQPQHPDLGAGSK